ncbi:MAG: hypothetical protein ACRDPG_12675 [Nocardioidaceae bacterium]
MPMPSGESGALTSALAGPLRRAHVSFAATWAGESAFMVALSVVAFREGGLGAVGVVTAVRMAMAALLTPFLATVADRIRRERVLTGIGVVRAVALGTAAAVTAADGPALVIYGAAVVATAAVALFRPAHSALLPALAKSPSDLTSANAVRGMLDSLSTLGGPGGGRRRPLDQRPGSRVRPLRSAFPARRTGRPCPALRPATPGHAGQAIPGP